MLRVASLLLSSNFCMHLRRASTQASACTLGLLACCFFSFCLSFTCDKQTNKGQRKEEKGTLFFFSLPTAALFYAVPSTEPSHEVSGIQLSARHHVYFSSYTTDVFQTLFSLPPRFCHTSKIKGTCQEAVVSKSLTGGSVHATILARTEAAHVAYVHLLATSAGSRWQSLAVNWQSLAVSWQAVLGTSQSGLRDSKGHVTVRVYTQEYCVWRTTPRCTSVCTPYSIPTYIIPTLTIITSIRITRSARNYIDQPVGLFCESCCSLCCVCFVRRLMASSDPRVSRAYSMRLKTLRVWRLCMRACCAYGTAVTCRAVLALFAVLGMLRFRTSCVRRLCCA